MKRNGPLPTISVTCTLGGILARRSGITGQQEDGLASAAGSSGNGFFSRNRITRSDGADRSSVTARTFWPNGSLRLQRSMLATASRASTGVPSWKARPSRSVIVHVRPSSSVTWPSTICGCGCKASSRP